MFTSMVISRSFNSFTLSSPMSLQHHLVWAGLGVFRDAWPHWTKNGSLRYYRSSVTSSKQKFITYSLTEISVIKEPRNLIDKSILVLNLQTGIFWVCSFCKKLLVLILHNFQPNLITRSHSWFILDNFWSFLPKGIFPKNLGSWQDTEFLEKLIRQFQVKLLDGRMNVASKNVARSFSQMKIPLDHLCLLCRNYHKSISNNNVNKNRTVGTTTIIRASY